MRRITVDMDVPACAPPEEDDAQPVTSGSHAPCISQVLIVLCPPQAACSPVSSTVT